MEEETWTEERIKLYKEFIDGLLGWPRTSVIARRVREWGDGKPKTYCVTEEFDKLMASLTPEQREAIAGLLQNERDSGIHETLTFLDDGPYEIHVVKDDGNRQPLPHEPYFNFLHEDWTSRSLGYPWYDEEEEVAAEAKPG